VRTPTSDGVPMGFPSSLIDQPSIGEHQKLT